MKKRSGLLGLLAVGFLAASFAATAQEVPNIRAKAKDTGEEGGGQTNMSGANGNDRRLYVSPMFTYTYADSDRNTKDGIGGTIAVGKKMTSGLNLELTGYYSRMKADDGSNQTTQLTGIGAAAMIFPFSGSLTNLYTVLALHQGEAKNHPTTPVTTGFDYRGPVFDVGLGYMLGLSQWLGGYDMALRAEARYRYDDHTRLEAGRGGKQDFYDGVANVGLFIPLGKLPVEGAPQNVEVVQPAAPADSDGDGVPDDQDQCPDTPAGTTVNEQGCPPDADGDGVPDDKDQCPDTPAGTQVDEKGCPAVKDSDGDGIPDDKDQCPDTPAGTQVDANGCAPKPAGCRAPAPGEPINLEGCATGESVVLKGVNFEVNSTRLTANAKVILNQVADSLSANPNLKVEIAGHTDGQGADAFNLKLSQKRADAVKRYLVSRGIDASRLTAKGYGKTQPVDTNETPEGRELNRRVEMKVLEGGGAAAPAGGAGGTGAAPAGGDAGGSPSQTPGGQ